MPKTINGQAVHPAANLFPMMDEQSYEQLKEDIKANGQKESVVFYDEQIIDGRNRFRACYELGIEVDGCELDADIIEEMDNWDPVAWVLSHNLHRRHLKTSQRAMIAAKMANLPNGGDRSAHRQMAMCSIEDASVRLSASEKSVSRCKHILDNGSAALVEAVENNVITANMAYKLCQACDDKRKQTALVKEGKQAIKEFLNPEPVEEAAEPEPVETYADEDPEIGDKFDHPAVKAVQHADYRLNTLKMIFKTLEPHELIAAKGLIEAVMNT